MGNSATTGSQEGYPREQGQNTKIVVSLDLTNSYSSKTRNFETIVSYAQSRSCKAAACSVPPYGDRRYMAELEAHTHGASAVTDLRQVWGRNPLRALPFMQSNLPAPDSDLRRTLH